MATIQGIYIALFGRPADPIGLAFFNEATNNGADLTAIGDLTSTAEYQSRFEGMNNTQIVTAIYQSLFGRDPEPAGLLFFVAQLESGAHSINTIAINILDGAQGDDVLVAANKIEAANAWTAAVAADPDALAAYHGQVGIDAGVAFLAGITADEATIPTEAQLEADLAELIGETEQPEPEPEQPFILTSALGENVVGTEGNDEFRAVFDTANSADGTLNVGDQIDGLGGVDTLNLSIVGGNAAALPDGTSVKNVEIINLISTEAGSTLNVGFSAAAFAGAMQVWQVNEAVDISGVGTDVTAGFRDTDVDLTASYAGGVISASIALDNVAHAGTIRIDGADLQTVTLSGTVEADGTNVGSLNIDGAAAGNVETLNIVTESGIQTGISATTFGGLVTFDASDSTGAVRGYIAGSQLETIHLGSGNDSIGLAGGEVNLSVDLGAGDDRLTASAINSGLTITLGDGADEVIFNSAAGVDGYLRNISDASEGTIKSQIVSITDFNLNGAADWLTFVGTAAGQSTLNGDREALTDQEQLAVAASQSLFDALNIVADSLELEAWTTFQYDGNTYIFQNDNTAGFNGGPGGAIDARGDGVVELVGFTGELTGANLVLA